MCKMNFDNLFDIVYYSIWVNLGYKERFKFIRNINKIKIKIFNIRSHLYISSLALFSKTNSYPGHNLKKYLSLQYENLYLFSL